MLTLAVSTERMNCQSLAEKSAYTVPAKKSAAKKTNSVFFICLVINNLLDTVLVFRIEERGTKRDHTNGDRREYSVERSLFPYINEYPTCSDEEKDETEQSQHAHATHKSDHQQQCCVDRPKHRRDRTASVLQYIFLNRGGIVSIIYVSPSILPTVLCLLRNIKLRLMLNLCDILKILLRYFSGKRIDCQQVRKHEKNSNDLFAIAHRCLIFSIEPCKYIKYCNSEEEQEESHVHDRSQRRSNVAKADISDLCNLTQHRQHAEY